MTNLSAAVFLRDATGATRGRGVVEKAVPDEGAGRGIMVFHRSRQTCRAGASLGRNGHGEQRTLVQGSSGNDTQSIGGERRHVDEDSRKTRAQIVTREDELPRGRRRIGHESTSIGLCESEEPTHVVARAEESPLFMGHRHAPFQRVLERTSPVATEPLCSP